MGRYGCLRWDAKTDENQKRIIGDLRELGFSVQSLGRVGEGCPDILVGDGGRNFLFEIKPRGKKLRQNQEEWKEAWRGRKPIRVETTQEILQHVKLFKDDQKGVSG